MPNKEVQRTLIDPGAQLEEVITWARFQHLERRMSPYRGRGRRGPPGRGSVGLGGFMVSGEGRWH